MNKQFNIWLEDNLEAVTELYQGFIWAGHDMLFSEFAREVWRNSYEYTNTYIYRYLNG